MQNAEIINRNNNSEHEKDKLNNMAIVELAPFDINNFITCWYNNTFFYVLLL